MITTFTAFAGQSLVATGTLEVLLPKLKSLHETDAAASVLVFEDATGKQADFDLRGTMEDVLARAMPAPARQGPGRPRLGVVSREISLLPHHWEWLETQPNGASAAIRRLVEEARKRDPEAQKARLAKDATVRFLTSMAGNLPGYEESTRALYSANLDAFQREIGNWPKDIRDHALKMSEPIFQHQK